ncbi:hypothetical protein AYJ01_13595 [Shewanella algae]|uniref:hypothetical protein n=1 Tax=Shewanella algae TaxID=38313 RepID=UPI001183D78F|nr:hypothetical protein [Shewanella algae]TVK92874.1 hypothetical protein AYJ01_13595 [Shewanella algae]
MIENTLSTQRNDQPLKVHTLSLLVPARRYEANFDVTAQQALPAIIECALMLIAQLDKISAGELQDYFGLNSNEREGLLKEILETGLAEEDRDGLLVPSRRLREARSNQQGISLEEIVNYNQSFVVDHLTRSIQPRADDKPLRGLPTLEVSQDKEQADPASLFTSQFDRFQQSTTVDKLKRFNTKLYRINHCNYLQLTYLPVSLDVYASSDPLTGLRLKSELIGFPEQVRGLLTTSGLHGEVNKYLDIPIGATPQLDFLEYIKAVDDPLLPTYIDEGNLDLGKLLRDKKQRKISYENNMTIMLVGPLYLDSNRGRLMQWLSHIKSNARLAKAIWLPASTPTWGAHVGLKQFINICNKTLASYGSSLEFLVPVRDKHERFNVNDKFGASISRIIGLPKAPDLNEMEIFVIPGDPGWALVQYHARLPESCGMSGLTLPVGYCTCDPSKVELIWSLLKERLGNDLQNVSAINGDQEGESALSKLLDSDWDTIKAYYNTEVQEPAEVSK